jgi:hypothetical protein
MVVLANVDVIKKAMDPSQSLPPFSKGRKLTAAEELATEPVLVEAPAEIFVYLFRWSGTGAASF